MSQARQKSEFLPHGRIAKFMIALLALLAAYIMGSRALDTGSIGQYGLTLLFIFFAGKYLIRFVRPS